MNRAISKGGHITVERQEGVAQRSWLVNLHIGISIDLLMVRVPPYLHVSLTEISAVESGRPGGAWLVIWKE
jgi:hypothetical protein